MQLSQSTGKGFTGFWCAVFGAMIIYALVSIGKHPNDLQLNAATLAVVIVLLGIIYLHVRFELSLYDVSFDSARFTASRFDQEKPILFAIADIESATYRPRYPRSPEQISLRVRREGRPIRIAFSPEDNFKTTWLGNDVTRELLKLSGIQ